MSDNDKLDNETPAEEIGVPEDFSEMDAPENDQDDDTAFFDEEAGFSGDDEFLEEDWEAYDDEFAEESVDAAPAKKKKSKSDKLIIGGGAVVGVLVLLFMMGGGGDNPAPQKTASVPLAATAEQQLSAVKKQAQQGIQAPANQRDMVYGRTNEQSADEENKEQAGFFNNPEILDEVERQAEEAYENTGFGYEDEYQEEASGTAAADEDGVQEDSVPPMPTPIRQTEADTEDDMDDGFMLDSDIDFEAEMETAEEIPRSPADQLRQPEQNEASSVSLPKAQDIMIRKTPDMAASVGVDMAQIEALGEKLDRISGRLDSMESMVASLEGNMVHHSDIPDISALERSVQSLEKKVSALSISQKATTSSYQEEAPVSRPQTKEKTVSTVLSPAKKASVSTISADVKEESWILKSIRPGTAWVSRKGDSDMKTVQVGDSLPGVGTITAIDYMDDQWVVLGTTSKITQ